MDLLQCGGRSNLAGVGFVFSTCPKHVLGQAFRGSRSGPRVSGWGLVSIRMLPGDVGGLGAGRDSVARGRSCVWSEASSGGCARGARGVGTTSRH